MHSFVGNGIPPIHSETYGYDQLDQPAKTNNDKQHYYDSLINMRMHHIRICKKVSSY